MCLLIKAFKDTEFRSTSSVGLLFFYGLRSGDVTGHEADLYWRDVGVN
jgi:hypothetical protein